MPGMIEIPSKHWGAFEIVRTECRGWSRSYHRFVQYCLLHGAARQFGEWVTDELSPARWAQGIERGFVRAAPTHSDADAQPSECSEKEK